MCTIRYTAKTSSKIFFVETVFINSGNLNNSDNYARYLGIQSSGFPAQPTNRNQSTTIISSGTVKRPIAPPFPPLNNANQPKTSCEKCRGNHILATCPDYLKCSPGQRFDTVSKNSLCSNCLGNKHKKEEKLHINKTLPNMQRIPPHNAA